MKIELSEKKAQPILSIRTRTSLENLPQIIGESYHKIADYLAELGEQPSEVPFTAYYNMDMQDLDVEMGFPVSRALPGKNNIKAGEIEPGKIISCMHKGPYSAMEATYNRLFQWIEEKGHQPKGVYYEYYYNSTDDVPESELLTRIVIPIK